MRTIEFKTMFTAGLVAGSLLATGCTSPSSPAPAAEDNGTVTMPLTTVAGGATYRVANLAIFIQGPTFDFFTESDPDETVLSTSLTTGSYTAFLENWTLQKDDGTGNFATVLATLESSPVSSFSIFNGSTTTLTYVFKTDGVIVTAGSGNLDVAVAIDETPGACTPLGTDCPMGMWCPPPGLTGADLACIASGTVTLGQPCASPNDCVANSSCVDAGAGPVCVALCSSSAVNTACSTGGACTSAGADFGLCE